MNIKICGNYFYIGTSNDVQYTTFWGTTAYRPVQNISVWDFRTMTTFYQISPPRVWSFHANGNHLLVKNYESQGAREEIVGYHLKQWDVRNMGDSPFASIKYDSLEDFSSDWQSIYTADFRLGLKKLLFG